MLPAEGGRHGPCLGRGGGRSIACARKRAIGTMSASAVFPLSQDQIPRFERRSIRFDVTETLDPTTHVDRGYYESNDAGNARIHLVLARRFRLLIGIKMDLRSYGEVYIYIIIAPGTGMADSLGLKRTQRVNAPRGLSSLMGRICCHISSG